MAIKEDGLSQRWESFHLTEGENDVIQISEDTIKGSNTRGEHCLMALLVYEKGYNRDAFKATMSKVWRLQGCVVFKEVGDNRFIMDFQYQVDKDKVLHGRPWFFNCALMVIQAFDGGMTIKDIPFSHEPFWVQIYNLPLIAMTHEVGIQVGRRIGVVHELDVDKEGLGWGKCL
ncbi:uncharacterized protein LOC122306249 [Carya illinoinensis]|uniref:uncharacterized protein LOC122306249 n=1 Tax=Carya illinoinensis TaxID=32201 RepID=UPI001C7232BC|nr:uncharacterized protein LOC122306249 [Carya illinoinensis]